MQKTERDLLDVCRDLVWSNDRDYHSRTAYLDPKQVSAVLKAAVRDWVRRTDEEEVLLHKVQHEVP